MLWYKMGSRPHSRNSNRDLRATTACTFWTSQLQKVLRTPSLFFNFWLRNVLRAKTACTFSTSQLPKVLRHWGVFCILTWKCASCHNGVHFLIYLFARFDSFSSLTFFLFLSLLWLFPPLLLHLSILSKVWLLNFLRWMMIWMVGSGFRIGGSSQIFQNQILHLRKHYMYRHWGCGPWWSVGSAPSA